MCGEEVSRNPVRVATSYRGVVDPGLPEGNPGLELANAFSVVRRTLQQQVLSLCREDLQTFQPDRN